MVPNEVETRILQVLRVVVRWIQDGISAELFLQAASGASPLLFRSFEKVQLRILNFCDVQVKNDESFKLLYVLD